MSVLVRQAVPADVEVVYSLGQGDPAFAVSERISFYERTELTEWIGAPENNILLVAEVEGQVGGFLFCKVMSHHWAMLDNFYVAPPWRGRQCGRELLRGLAERLRKRHTVYLSALVRQEDSWVSRYLEELGFAKSRAYVWHEVFLAQAGF